MFGVAGSSGTLNVPFVTTNALVAPVGVTQLPDPENDPVTFVLEIDVTVTVPEVVKQR